MPSSSTATAPKAFDRKSVGPYEVRELLGYGTFGQVFRVQHGGTGMEYACKVMSLQKIKLDNLGEQVKREISVLRQLDHVNVVHLVEVLKGKKHMYLICELVDGGDLFSVLVKRRRLSERDARDYFRQIVRGIEYCHGLGVCHRDFKPENILLTKEGVVKIADFGFSNAFLQQGAQEEILMKTLCGTPNYISPEILAHSRYSGVKTDVWSLGVVLFFMCSGRLPFDQESNDDLFAAIVKGEYEEPTHFSADLRDLVRGMLNVDATDRSTPAQVAAHRWMRGDGEGEEEEGISEAATAAAGSGEDEGDDAFSSAIGDAGEAEKPDLMTADTFDVAGLRDAARFRRRAF